MIVEATEQEANDLLQLLDIAVKAGGLRTANSALTWARKLEQAASQEEQNNGDD